MRTSLFSRLFLSLVAATSALLVTGCHTPQRSAGAPIPPNWYDSAYYKDGALVNPEISQTAPTAGPSAR